MMEKDSWGRYKRLEPTISPNYVQQLELQLNKTTPATPEEEAEWQEKELNWWGDRQLLFIAIAALVQLSALGFMATVMYLTSLAL